MQRVGRGGFGEVWKAVGHGNVALALKFLLVGEDAARVERESLERMKDIRHANLLALFGAWQSQEYLILAMELANGTLAERCREFQQQGQPGIPLRSCSTACSTRPGPLTTSTNRDTRWAARSAAGCSTATSSRRTCCSSAAASRWPTSAW